MNRLPGTVLVHPITGKFWAGGSDWVEEYPDAFEIHPDECPSEDAAERFEEEGYYPDFLEDDDVNWEKHDQNVLLALASCFVSNPELGTIRVISGLGYDDEVETLYHREDIMEVRI